MDMVTEEMLVVSRQTPDLDIVPDMSPPYIIHAGSLLPSC